MRRKKDSSKIFTYAADCDCGMAALKDADWHRHDPKDPNTWPEENKPIVAISTKIGLFACVHSNQGTHNDSVIAWCYVDKLNH